MFKSLRSRSKKTRNPSVLVKYGKTWFYFRSGKTGGQRKTVDRRPGNTGRRHSPGGGNRQGSTTGTKKNKKTTAQPYHTTDVLAYIASFTFRQKQQQTHTGTRLTRVPTLSFSRALASHHWLKQIHASVYAHIPGPMHAFAKAHTLWLNWRLVQARISHSNNYVLTTHFDNRDELVHSIEAKIGSSCGKVRFPDSSEPLPITYIIQAAKLSLASLPKPWLLLADEKFNGVVQPSQRTSCKQSAPVPFALRIRHNLYDGMWCARVKHEQASNFSTNYLNLSRNIIFCGA